MKRACLCWFLLLLHGLAAFESPEACLAEALKASRAQDLKQLQRCFATPASQNIIAPLYLRIFRFQVAQRQATEAFDFTTVEDGFATAPALYRFLEGAPDLLLLTHDHTQRRNGALMILEHRRQLPDERVRVYRLRLRETDQGWFIDGPAEENQGLHNWFDLHVGAIDRVLPGLEAAVVDATTRPSAVAAIQQAAQPAGEFMQAWQAQRQGKQAHQTTQDEAN
jgi:hypothetical protein